MPEVPIAGAPAGGSAPEASSRYCAALAAMFESEPNAGVDQAEFGVVMAGYADAIESVAALSSADDALVMWEFGALARQFAADPEDTGVAERFAGVSRQASSITQSASRGCALGR